MRGTESFRFLFKYSYIVFPTGAGMITTPSLTGDLLYSPQVRGTECFPLSNSIPGCVFPTGAGNRILSEEEKNQSRSIPHRCGEGTSQLISFVSELGHVLRYSYIVRIVSLITKEHFFSLFSFPTLTSVTVPYITFIPSFPPSLPDPPSVLLSLDLCLLF